MTVTAEAECIEVTGPRVAFKVKAHDGVDLIGEGRHERFVVAWDKFNARVAAKAAEEFAWVAMMSELMTEHRTQFHHQLRAAASGGAWRAAAGA